MLRPNLLIIEVAMAIWQTNQSARRAPWSPPWLTRPGGAPPAPGVVRQYLIAGAVGVVLGGYIVATATLSSRLVPLLIVSVLCPFIAMILGSARRFLLGLILLDIPFPLDFHLNYQPELAELNALAGVNISVTTMALAILYALWFAEAMSRANRGPRPRVLTGVTAALALYIGFTVASLAVARDVALALNEITLLIQTFLLYIYLVANVRTRQDLLFIMVMLLGGLVLEGLIMGALRVVGHGITLPGISARIQGGRVAGTFGSPNAAASYLILFMAPAISIILNRVGRPRRLALLAFGLGVVALTLTLSRGGWLGFAVSMAFLLYAVWQDRKLSTGAVVLVVCGALLLSLLFRETISTRLVGEDASPPQTRIVLLRLAGSIISDYPLTGVGANNFVMVIDQYDTSDLGSKWIHVVHNKYLLVWAETGLGGLLAFLLFLATTLRQGWRCWKLHDPLLSPLALGLTAGILGQMMHMFFDIFHSRLQVQSLWVAAGLIAILSNLHTLDAAGMSEGDRARHTGAPAA